MTATAETPAPTVQTLDVTVSQTELVGALQFVTKTTRVDRNALAIFHGVLLDASDGVLTLARFDYEVASRQAIPARGAGRALVAAHTLLDLVKDLDKGCEITLSVKDNLRLLVTGDGVTYRLPLLPIDDFPALPSPGDNPVAALHPEQVTALLDVALAAGRNDTLPMLRTLSFVNRNGTLEVAATDRYRLAVYDTGVPAFNDNGHQLLVPVETVVTVAKLFKGVPVSLSWQADPVTRVTFFSDTRSVTVRTTDDQFPDYARLLPTNDSSTTLTVDSADLLKAIGQVNKVDRRAPMRGTADDGSITLRAGSEGDLQAEKTVSGQGSGLVTFGFTPGFAIDGIKATGGKQVHFAFAESDETIIRKPFLLSNPDRPDFRYLLMPLRLES